MLKSIEQERDYYKKENEKLKKKTSKLADEQRSASPTRAPKVVNGSSTHQDSKAAKVPFKNLLQKSFADIFECCAINGAWMHCSLPFIILYSIIALHVLKIVLKIGNT